MSNKVYYAIGDVHGRITEFKELITLINNDIEMHHKNSDVYIIQIGDLIDRGEDSKACLELAMDFDKYFPSDCTCIILKGNHEQTLEIILNGDEQRAIDWFNDNKGTGHTTLRDYGVDVSKIKTAEDIYNAVKNNIPKHHIEFTKSLPIKWQDGDYFFCHAGVDPNKKLHEQDIDDLLWIRKPFLTYEKAFEKIIIHGHSPFVEGEIQHNRVNTDAAAAYGEKLKCFILPTCYKIEDIRILEISIKEPSCFKKKHKGVAFLRSTE